MSRIRIYDLAKEADMASSTLADKLIDLGYNIKSHSSTVDDDTAEEIRRKVLGLTKTEVVEKRISGKGGATVIRRRTKTVRREPVSPPSVSPAVEAPVAETELTKPAAGEKEAVVEKVAEVAESDREKEVLPAPAEEPVVAEGAADEEQRPPDIVASEAEVKASKSAAPQDVQQKAKPRTGLARIIKKAAIKIEEPTPKPKLVKPPAAPSKRGVGPGGPGKRGDLGVAATEKPVAKGKKKGRRMVQFKPDAWNKTRGKKISPTGKRKGRRGGDFEKAGVRFRSPSSKKTRHEPQPPAAEAKAIKKRIRIYETITVGDLARRMGIKANAVIKRLMDLDFMATVNHALDIDTATIVAADFGFEVEQRLTEELHVLSLEEQEAGGEPLPRPPVVTVMGHVDHGKTSILDAIRKTDVALGEAGGITQHIGAYYVRSNNGDVVFLDTPGHAAFTEMRARGAQVTDIVVLVVAADDGVMDQTKEAINHALAAKVPIVVAINKIDKPNADPTRVQRELAELGLIPEEWGGQTIYCETSAKKNTGIQELLDNIQLQAEILELKADPKRKARGRVIEAELNKGRGAVATVLVQEGTLQTGEYFVVGQFYGKVRSLTNDHGEQVKVAGPAIPVEVQGLSGVPQAGDEFIVVPDEKMAKSVSASRQLKAREIELAAISKLSLDKLFAQMQDGEAKELRVVLRADVQGTLEAFGHAAEKLSTDAIKVRVLHEGTGTITESDVLLASASDAIILGFNVRPAVKVKNLAEREKVDIRSYDVIYNALDDIQKAMVGLLEPSYEERVIGSVEVRKTFRAPKVGTIAGCYVLDGKVERNSHVRVLRDGIVVYTGLLASLKRFKDDVKEVSSGYECGISVENFNDIKVGDVLEAFLIDEVAATL